MKYKDIHGENQVADLWLHLNTESGCLLQDPGNFPLDIPVLDKELEIAREAAARF